MDSRKIALRRWSLFLLFWSVSAVFGGTLKWQWMAPLAGVYIAFLCLGWWEEARRLAESDKGFAPLMIALIVFAPPIGITSLLIWFSFRKKHCTGEVLVMPEMYVWRVIPLALLAKLAVQAGIFAAFKPTGSYVTLNWLFLMVILWHALLLYLPLAPGLQKAGQIIRKSVTVLFFAVTAPYLYYLWTTLISINGLPWGDCFSGGGWSFVLGYSPYANELKDTDAYFTGTYVLGMIGMSGTSYSFAFGAIALIVLLLTRRLPPLFFTAAVALLLFPLTILGWLSVQMASPNTSPFADTLHSCIGTSWKTVVPLLVGFDILQLGARRFSINLREIHSRWSFLRIERNIPLEHRVLRGTVLGLAVAIYLSLIAIGAINYAVICQLLCFSLPPAPPLPKGQANAFDIMQERFMKKTSPYLPAPSPPGHSAKGGKWGYLFTPEEKAEFDTYWNANLPYFEDFRRAAEAGIYQHRPRNIHFMEAKVPNFVNIRSTAYAIATRAEILIGEGRMQEAIEAPALLVRFGAMLQTDGMLVQRMIGVAVKGIAFDTFQAVYQWDRGSETAKPLSGSSGGPLRDNGADMDSLFATLHGLLPYARKDVWKLLTDFMDHEFGQKWPARVSIVAGITVPGMVKAKNTICLKTMQFDTLYLGAACRVYKARHGRYPSDPKELIPEKILPLWPRDPWSRKPYVLEVNGDRLIIRTVQPPSEKDIPGVRLEYPGTQETKTTERMEILEQRSRNRTRET